MFHTLNCRHEIKQAVILALMNAIYAIAYNYRSPKNSRLQRGLVTGSNPIEVPSFSGFFMRGSQLTWFHICSSMHSKKYFIYDFTIIIIVVVNVSGAFNGKPLGSHP